MKPTNAQEKVAAEQVAEKAAKKQRREEVLLNLKSGVKAGGCWAAKQ